MGITREAAMQIIRKEGRFQVREKLFRPAELFSADEVFFTGTAAEIIPVTRIDSRPIGKGRPGPITLGLMESFKSLVRKEAGTR